MKESATINNQEDKPGGYICTGCGKHRPQDWSVYAAYNAETHEEVRNLCAICVCGPYAKFRCLPWKNNGPYRQEA